MLELPELVRAEQLNNHTNFILFESEDVIGPSDSNPKVHNRGTSRLRSRRTPCVNNSANDNDSDCGSNKTVDSLPPLPVNDILACAVSDVQLLMDELAPPHIYKLFALLVDPPTYLDCDQIEGLRGYLSGLLVDIGKLVVNGVRELVSHCWWVLLSNFSHTISRLPDFYTFYSAMQRQRAPQTRKLGTDHQYAEDK